MIDIGQIAPDFTLPEDRGANITLSELRPAPVVLYFYPKDDTPGCTLQARDFTARIDEFAAAGAVVLGVSKDSLARHEKFRIKYNLGIALLSDENADICERYGVWQEKNNFGKTYMGIARSTFLIDANGKIARIWRKVDVKVHVAEVLEAVKSL